MREVSETYVTFCMGDACVYSFKEGVNRDEAKEKVVWEIAVDLAGDGSRQIEFARDGFQGINYMSDGQVAEQCWQYGLYEYVDLKHIPRAEWDRQQMMKKKE